LPAPFTAWAAEAEDALAHCELDATPFICADGLASGAARPVVEGVLLGSRVGMIESFMSKLSITFYFITNTFTNEHLKPEALCGCLSIKPLRQQTSSGQCHG